MKTILACTDFSTGSYAATEYAAALAAAVKANLVLVHVMYNDTKKSTDPIAEKKREVEMNAKLLLNCDTLRKKTGVKAKAELRKGLPVDEIIGVTRRLGASLIVTGARETAAGSGLVGGLVYDLMHASVVPVLAVPAEAKFKPFERIALAIDPKSKTAYDDSVLIEFIRVFKSALYIITVAPPETVEKNLKSASITAVEHRYAETMHRIVSIENESLPNGIRAATKQYATDLLVIIPHRNYYMDRMMKKTNTQRVLKVTPSPLLTLPRGE